MELPVHLGAHPDPRLVASLRAMRGVLPAAAAADESLTAWLSAVHEGGATALAKRSDLPSEPYKAPGSSRVWGIALMNFLVLSTLGVVLAAVSQNLLFGVGGVLLGFGAAHLTVVIWRAWKLLGQDGEAPRDPALGRGARIAPENRFYPVEALLSGGAPVAIARRYRLSESTLSAWASVYLDGAQTALKARFGPAESLTRSG